MDRPTKKVLLEISGITAEVYTYYLRGERKEIEAVMLQSAEFEEDPETGKPKLKKVDATYRARMEDKAVILAIKSLIDKEGKPITLTIEALDILPDEDFKVLQDSLPTNQPKKK